MSSFRKYAYLFVVVVTAVAFAAVMHHSLGKSGDYRPVKAAGKEAIDEEPVMLNSVISNNLSELPETFRLDRAVESFMRKWEIVGASLAIMKDDRLIYCKGYGYADLHDSIQTQPSHLFRIASVSKLITAVAVMRLVEDGRLTLGSRVFGPLGILNHPDFLDIHDHRMEDITVEDLLRHRSGFSSRSGDPMFNSELIGRTVGHAPPFTTEEVVRYASQCKLRTVPGDKFSYSNLGYVVLSAVVARAAGMEYEQYVQQYVLNPAGCHDMHLAGNYHCDRFPNEVCYYEPDTRELVDDVCGGAGMVPKCYGGNNVRLLGGAGGWVASAPEILRFVASIDGDPAIPDILSRRSIRYMTDYHEDIAPIGWSRSTEYGDWTRTGSMSGTSALLKRQSDGFTWFLITNTSSWRGWRLTRVMHNAIRDAFEHIEEWPDRDMFSPSDIRAMN